MGLFDFQASAFRKTLFQLGQGEFQNAVHILGFDLVGIHAGDVKASGIRAIGALHADHFILLVLFLDYYLLAFSLTHGTKSRIMIVDTTTTFYEKELPYETQS